MSAERLGAGGVELAGEIARRIGVVDEEAPLVGDAERLALRQRAAGDGRQQKLRGPLAAGVVVPQPRGGWRCITVDDTRSCAVHR